jgi:hypothetical protein
MGFAIGGLTDKGSSSVFQFGFSEGWADVP